MDHLQTRLEALEQQVQTLTQQTRRANRRLHWWRGLACGVVVLAGLTWTLLSSKAVDAQSETLANRLSAPQDVLETLEGILRHVKVVTTPDGLKEVLITGANLHIVNGLGSTSCTDEGGNEIPDCPNGLGNLIVGYNEPRNDPESPDVCTGSHNVVVGQRHNFSRFGGVVVGDLNTISGGFASVSAGDGNEASGGRSSVSGGPLTGPAALGPRSAGDVAIRPAALTPRSAAGVATRPAATAPPSAAGKALPKRLTSAGRLDRKVMRSWWATSAPRNLPREATSSKPSRGMRREPAQFPTGVNKVGSSSVLVREGGAHNRAVS
jgi:hypothetical protein